MLQWCMLYLTVMSEVIDMCMAAVCLVLAISGPGSSEIEVIPMQSMEACNREALEWVKRSTMLLGDRWPSFTAQCVSTK